MKKWITATIVAIISLSSAFGAYQYEGYFKISDLPKAAPQALKITQPFIKPGSQLVITAILTILGHPKYENFDPNTPLTLIFFHDKDLGKSNFLMTGKFKDLSKVAPLFGAIGWSHQKLGDLDVFGKKADFLDLVFASYKSKIASIAPTLGSDSFKAELIFTHKHWDPLLEAFNALAVSASIEDAVLKGRVDHEPHSSTKIPALIEKVRKINGLKLTTSSPNHINIEIKEEDLPNVYSWWAGQRN